MQVTISAGIAGDIGSQLQVDALVDQADAAMYAAKSLGRNRIYVYRNVDENAPVRRAPISAEHREAASAIGRWASDTATEALASVLAPQPHHRGRPSDMIAALATGMALALGLPREEIERIRMASLLHDLGKLAVPSEILDKPAALSDGEWQAIGEHPRIGQVILEHASALREAIPVVLHHHERFNGGGYPHGLRGNEIPLGARIVAVADAYHAMVHDRPYKPAQTHDQALDELRRHAGTQFDPEVVDLFCGIYARGAPPDGLEEVYRLHERARGGLERIDVRAAARALASTPLERTSGTPLNGTPEPQAHPHPADGAEPAGPARRRKRNGKPDPVVAKEPQAAPAPRRRRAARSGGMHEAAG
jgi:response regulator RpfG family c-di-GMP phosphodiesterase